MDKALQKAIEGGWPKAYKNGGHKTTVKLDSSDLLDPDFWKALGKGEGWYKGEYVQKAQDFIYDIFAIGKTPDEFFNTLLNK